MYVSESTSQKVNQDPFGLAGNPCLLTPLFVRLTGILGHCDSCFSDKCCCSSCPDCKSCSLIFRDFRVFYFICVSYNHSIWWEKTRDVKATSDPSFEAYTRRNMNSFHILKQIVLFCSKKAIHIFELGLRNVEFQQISISLSHTHT